MEIVLTDWIAIVISVLALGFSAWEHHSTQKKMKEQAERTRRDLEEQEERNHRRSEQQAYSALLELFLLPLATSIGRARVGFQHLQRGTGIHELEYWPHRLRALFETLPDDRRILWQVEIAQLHSHNDRATQLIDTYASRSRLGAAFQQRCEDFRLHATTWKARWDAVVDLKVPQSDLPDGPLAGTFPKGFDQAIRDETERVRQQAGAERSTPSPYEEHT